jgi:hypothetical protein
MKPESEFEPEESLIEAALRDDGWQAANAAVKAEALKAFRGRQRARRLTRWAGTTAAVALAAGAAFHWLARRQDLAPTIATQPVPVKTATNSPAQLTDQQLLACFPQGTCFIAEVDGVKKLVFFNPDAERNYVAYPSVPAR